MIQAERVGVAMGVRPGTAIEPTFQSALDGCQHSPSCLTCPLPQCKYDVQYYRPHPRQAEAFKLVNQGILVRHAAEAVGVSERAVHRWLAKERARQVASR